MRAWTFAAVAALFATTPALAAKRDFRGVENGMTLREAFAAAEGNGLRCQTTVFGVNACSDKDASLDVILTSKGRVCFLRVNMIGRFDEREIAEQLAKAYDLTPTESPGLFTMPDGESFSADIGPANVGIVIVSKKVAEEDSPTQPNTTPKL